MTGRTTLRGLRFARPLAGGFRIRDRTGAALALADPAVVLKGMSNGRRQGKGLAEQVARPLRRITSSSLMLGRFRPFPGTRIPLLSNFVVIRFGSSIIVLRRFCVGSLNLLPSR